MKSPEHLGFHSEEEQMIAIAEVLLSLETFSRKKLSNQDEIQMWTRRLKQYPRMVLAKLLSYTGHFSNDVFAFLEEELRLQRVSQLDSIREIFPPTPLLEGSLKEQNISRKISRVMIKYIKMVLSGKYTREKLAAIEWKLIQRNRKRWPHVRWDYGFQVNIDRERAAIECLEMDRRHP